MMPFASSPRWFSVLVLGVYALCSLEGAGCASQDTEAPTLTTALVQPDKTVARDISDVELVAMMADRPDLVLIDVRTQKEWDDGHIGGACFLDFLENDFATRAAALPKDRPIAVYCAAGGRSADAMVLLSKQGFKEVYNLRDGYYGWEDAGRGTSHDPAVALPAASGDE